MLRFFFMAAALLVAALGVSAGIAPASGQAIPKSLQEGGTEEVVKQRLNQWTIGVAGGNLDGTNLRFADEIRRALDDGDELRVIPMITRGTASNLEDLLYLHGVDVAFTQSDVFEYFRTQRKIPNLEKRIQYVIRLPVAELHILAGAGIRTLEDLRGKKVVFGAAGNASTLTGPIVFQRLGIQVEPVFVSRAEGLRRLMAGEAAALLASLPKPIDFYLKIVPNSGLHMVPVPFTRVFADLYAVGELTNADIRTSFRPASGSIRSRLRRSSPSITGPRTPTGIAGSNGSSSTFSTDGTSSPSRPSIRGGATSTWPRRSPAGPGSQPRKRCCARRRTARTSPHFRISRPISPGKRTLRRALKLNGRRCSASS